MRNLFAIMVLVVSSLAMAGDFDAMLIGGSPVKPGEYPEVVRIRSCSGTQCAGCTATVVGKRAVVTAGHCLLGSGEVSFMLGQNEYKAQCEAHPLYPNTEDMDMALCKTEKDMDVKYAHISKQGPALNEIVTLIGYGCIREGGGGGNDGILRVGEAPVIQLPTAQPVNNWFYTRGSSALCFGDSGGPSFKRVRDPKNETHYVIGQNSRGNIRDLSLLTASYLDKGIKFFEAFEQKHGIKICGISDKCGSVPQPDPNKCKYEKSRLDYYKGKVVEWQKKYDQCQAQSRDDVDQLPNLPSEELLQVLPAIEQK